MPAGINLRMTRHAVHRWRERVSTCAADDGVEVIVAAIVAAARVPKDEPLPFPRSPGTTYYRHPTLGDIYFVTAPDRDSAGRIEVLVMVIDARQLWGVPREFVARG